MLLYETIVVRYYCVHSECVIIVNVQLCVTPFDVVGALNPIPSDAKAPSA